MKRPGRLVRRSRMLAKPRRWPAGMRDAVYARSGGRCDYCREHLNPRRWECHHRKLRSQGGRDQMVNLLALHHACHTRVHGDPAWSYLHGFLVRRRDDPADRPVWRHRERWQLPLETQWHRAEPPDGWEQAA